MTPHFFGLKFRVMIEGRRLWTPLVVVLVAIGTADVVFAVDSIPAIYGITKSPFIVFTANVFALMGLRQLYFLLGDLIDKLVYLHLGIAFILSFIGAKLVLHALHENEVPFINGGNPVLWAPDIGTWESLIVIVVAMAIAVGASLLRLRSERTSGN
jgi:tellurite resistance protein TerC